MRCVVSEVKEKRVKCLCLCANEVHTPFCKKVCRVSPRINGIKTVPHVVSIVSAVCVIVVHHIAEEPMKMIEAAFARVVLRFESKVPLTDECRPIRSLFQGCRERNGILPKIPPTVFWMGANHTWHPDPIGIASGHQRRTAWRTDRGIRVKSGKPCSVFSDPVNIRGLD